MMRESRYTRDQYVAAHNILFDLHKYSTRIPYDAAVEIRTKALEGNTEEARRLIDTAIRKYYERTKGA